MLVQESAMRARIKKIAIISLAVLSICVIFISLIKSRSPESSILFHPPLAKRIRYEFKVQDQLFVDQYHWMNAKDKELQQYVKAEQKYLEKRLTPSLPDRKAIYNEILSLESSRIGVNTHLFHEWVQNDMTFDIETSSSGIPKYYRRKMSESRKLFFDTQRLCEEEEIGYFSVGFFEVSPSNSDLVALGIDRNGSENFHLVLYNSATDSIIFTDIHDVYYSVRWSRDGQYLYYNRVDEKSVPRIVMGLKVNFENLTAKNSLVIYEEPDEKFVVTVESTSDGEHVYVNSAGISSNEIFLIESQMVSKLRDRQPNVMYKIDHHPQSGFICMINNDPWKNNAIYMVGGKREFREPEKWKMLLGSSNDRYLTRMEVFHYYLVVWYWSKGNKAFLVWDFQTLSVINEFKSSKENYALYPGIIRDEEERLYRGFNDIKISFSNCSLSLPHSLYSYDLQTGKITLAAQENYPSIQYSDYKEFKISVQAFDKKEIPISVIFKPKGNENVPSNRPLLLKAYGAYGGMFESNFETVNFPLLDRDFVIVIAHVRGDADLGYSWYLDGKLDKKTNSISDFISVIDFVLEKGWTRSSKLAIFGRSAGGVVIGGTLNQAGHKIKAAVAQVPFVDVIGSMINSNVSWTAYEWDEWGDPIHNETILKAMMSYSPYENVQKLEYPNLLLTGGLKDTRVGFHEPSKMVAKIRYKCQCPSQLILLKVNEEGHFFTGDPYFQETALIYSFLLQSIQ